MRMVLLMIGLSVALKTQAGFFGGIIVAGNQQENRLAGRVVSNEGATYGVRLGYQFNRYVAAELGYEHYSDLDVTSRSNNQVLDETIKTASTRFGIKGILPVQDQISVFVRTGVAYWNYEYTAALPQSGIRLNDRDESFDIYYGIGASARVSEHFSVGVDYNFLQYDVEVLNLSGEYQVDGFAVNFGVSF